MSSETKNCQSCKADFVIEPADFAFYEKMKVPAPTWCPQCRLMRRFTWRNERALYKRTCDLCKKDIIAMYPAEASFPVYCQECWYGDGWDATQYARDYDFSKPFFVQFHELLQVVPQIALQVSQAVNSDYVNQVAKVKNCYLIASGSDNEDCMYSYRILYSKDVVDSTFVGKLENSYEALQCGESSGIFFGDDCVGSADLWFCSDAHSSQNCFMSSNVRNKSYVFRNKELSKEQYLDKMKAVDTGSCREIEKYREEYRALRERRLHKYMEEKNSPDSTGNAVAHSKNAKHCFVTMNLEDCRYCLMIADAKDSYDVSNGCCVMERIYECSTTGVNAANNIFSADVWPEVRDAAYSQSCRNDAENLFGCVAIRKKKYCILNKEYSREEYEVLREKIIKHMDEVPYADRKGRVYKFGEFFPPELSIYAYNETPAQDFLPKTKEEVEAMGFDWKDIDHKKYSVDIKSEDLPDHIKDVPDDITKKVIGCRHEGGCNHQCPGAFRVTSAELSFYRRVNIPIPRLCSNCRHYERFAMTNPYQLWERNCQCEGVESSNKTYKNISSHVHGNKSCSNAFQTSYAPSRSEVVYCKDCYQAEVI